MCTAMRNYSLQNEGISYCRHREEYNEWLASEAEYLDFGDGMMMIGEMTTCKFLNFKLQLKITITSAFFMF